MTARDRVRAFFADATVLEDRNTYNHRIDGSRLRVDKVGVSYFDATVLDGEPQGEPFRGAIPTRVKDIVSVDDRQITFRLGDEPSLKGHTVTYRKV